MKGHRNISIVILCLFVATLLIISGLTSCKDKLVHYYAKFGFRDEGISEKSVHGGVVWHQMRLTF